MLVEAHQHSGRTRRPVLEAVLRLSRRHDEQSGEPFDASRRTPTVDTLIDTSRADGHGRLAHQRSKPRQRRQPGETPSPRSPDSGHRSRVIRTTSYNDEQKAFDGGKMDEFVVQPVSLPGRARPDSRARPPTRSPARSRTCSTSMAGPTTTRCSSILRRDSRTRRSATATTASVANGVPGENAAAAPPPGLCLLRRAGARCSPEIAPSVCPMDNPRGNNQC